MIEVTAERSIPAPPDALWPLVSRPGAAAGLVHASPSASRCSRATGAGQRRRQHGHWGKQAESRSTSVITALGAAARAGVEPRGRAAERQAGAALRGVDRLQIELEPDGAGATRCRCARPRCRRARCAARIRAFGRREVAQHLRSSLERLAEVAAQPRAS